MDEGIASERPRTPSEAQTTQARKGQEKQWKDRASFGKASKKQEANNKLCRHVKNKHSRPSLAMTRPTKNCNELTQPDG